MKREILVVDDNSDIRFLICNILKEKDYSVRSAANYDQAVFEIKKKTPDLAIIDIKLDKGDRDGIDLLKLLIKINKNIPVIMISGHANVQVAVDAIRLGAYEFVEKPFSSEKILNYVKRGLESLSLKDERENLEGKLFHSFDFIGKSALILKVKKIIEKLSSADSRVLITGPTGSGKELVARKIHKNSSRSKHPFIVLNAALLKEKRYEKELFGEEYEDGLVSYGILEKANKGTLLIDEVSEVPLETQASILRVLIDQKFKRVNGSKDINVNIRIISSSSKDLNHLVANGDFREDLFHRLNVVPINIPSLQERTEDIPLLVDYFKKKLSEINGVPEANIDSSNDLLFTYDWPGNIRELRNLIERITILSVNENQSNINKILNDILTQSSSSNLSTNDLNNAMSFPLKEAREKFEKKYLLNQLQKNHGNISKTAEHIGMERSALHRKLKSLGIKGIN
ncbi:MAG: sigma-54-dependent Fis family transcriptional regulator [Pelagibacterales bacterium MED-G40]|nr:MAG: sigma-54-dependent Fis family transcriptional regulator [Pelagibacterales bacterium MED-G40]|tara:strand:+ start:5784 stop:7151 length:1368 start_codon:yes stop_codon:yes gene_type:complete